MDEIQYLLKPEWVTWDSVQECQRKAQESNNAKGFHMAAQDLSAEYLEKKMRGGLCFVALDGKRVVGVSGLLLFKGKNWWSFGKKVAYNCMDGILPEYQGTDVYFGLSDLRMKYIKESGADIIQSNTSEHNRMILKICEKKGFKKVRFSATGKNINVDYYSIIMAKWLKGCPYSDWFCNFMYTASKIIIKAIWKPGYKLRFG